MLLFCFNKLHIAHYYLKSWINFLMKNWALLFLPRTWMPSLLGLVQCIPMNEWAWGICSNTRRKFLNFFRWEIAKLLQNWLPNYKLLSFFLYPGTVQYFCISIASKYKVILCQLLHCRCVDSDWCVGMRYAIQS